MLSGPRGTVPDSDAEGTKRGYDEAPTVDTGHWDKVTIVRVGKDMKGSKDFFIHTHCLKEIRFFRACLDSGMKESTSGIVQLPEDNPVAFGVVVHWLYRGELSWDLEDLDGAEKDVKLRIVVRAWYLADKLMIESLQNAIIDHIDELGNNFDWSYSMPSS
jgi:hypothetical protein